MKPSKKQSGFSLVETMVGLGIAGAISLVLLNQQETSNKMQSKNVSDQNVNSAAAIIQTSLSNRSICSMSLVGKEMGDALTEIVEASINPLFPGASPAEFIKTLPVKQLAAVGQELPGDVGITEMKLYKDPATNKEYLNVIFDIDLKNRKKLFGGKTIARKFEIQTLKNPVTQKIISCHSEQTNILQSAVQQACLSMGASWINNACKMTNLPSCMIVDVGTCGTTYTQVDQYRWDVKVYGRKNCTTRYRRHCWGDHSSFHRTCSCGGSTGVACECNNGGAPSCYTKMDTVCTDNPDIKEVSALKCCRP